MGQFILRIGLRAFLLFFFSFTLLFFLVRLLGDPAQMLLGQRSDQTSLEMIRAQLHLDKPLWLQYLYAWKDWLPYEEGRWRVPTFGTSYYYGRPVSELYGERLPATALLSIGAFIVAMALGIGGGLWHAYKPYFLLQSFSLLLLALPSYVIGIFLVVLLAFKWGEWTGLPPSGYVYFYDPILESHSYAWERLILPVVSLALRPAAYLFQLTAIQARYILREDFIRAARARGKSDLYVLRTDVLRNLFPSLATAATQWLAGLFTGALFVEELFDWPGVGKLLFSALLSSDFPLIIGIAQFSILIFVLLYAVGELLSRWSDPRLR
ncbi:MAG: ABC transporter permease [Bacteroidia bacterium]|nr:ABC transporter permease [Bacteroidia bacterium]